MMMLRGCLGCERRFNTFGIRKLKSAIHLIGRDMIEKLALIFLRQ